MCAYVTAYIPIRRTEEEPTRDSNLKTQGEISALANQVFCRHDFNHCTAVGLFSGVGRKKWSYRVETELCVSLQVP